jgi:hypothetical protein
VSARLRGHGGRRPPGQSYTVVALLAEAGSLGLGLLRFLLGGTRPPDQGGVTWINSKAAPSPAKPLPSGPLGPTQSTLSSMADIDYESWEYEDLLRQAMRFETILRRDFRDDQPDVMAELEVVKTELARRNPMWMVDYDQGLKEL